MTVTAATKWDTRFWSKVDQTGDCWLWTAGLNAAGYGQFRLGSAIDGSRRKALAHRLSFELLVGPVPDGLELDHKLFRYALHKDVEE